MASETVYAGVLAPADYNTRLVNHIDPIAPGHAWFSADTAPPRPGVVVAVPYVEASRPTH
jgi:hypothetical protein